MLTAAEGLAKCATLARKYTQLPDGPTERCHGRCGEVRLAATAFEKAAELQKKQGRKRKVSKAQKALGTRCRHLSVIPPSARDLCRSCRQQDDSSVLLPPFLFRDSTV